MDQRQQIVLAAMASSALGSSFGPVQIQKLLFLIDREIPQLVEGPLFEFEAYDYGPFDRQVYDVLDSLAHEGHILIDHSFKYRSYAVTDSGAAAGQLIIDDLSEGARTFIADASEWVRSVSFQHLVSTIYKYYPEMKAASIFRDQ